MKTQHNRTVLAVDDDEINLMILIKAVQEAGYGVKSFSSGEAAWEFLEKNPGVIDIALFDKMMPGLSGLDLLRRIKDTEHMRHIPVIIQTGDVGVEQMREGLENGAYYYLTKPFHPEILEAILHSAENECKTRKDLLDHMEEGHTRFLSLLTGGIFSLKTHDEARLFAATIAHTAEYPEFVALGLMELLGNAIEHGNLEIGYDQKRQCMMDQNWQSELQSRMKNPEYANRSVQVVIEKIPTGFHLAIKDEGKGFDWERYMHDHDSSMNLNEPNGRGIAKAMIMLDDVRYTGKGNEVHCNVSLSDYLTMLHNNEKTAAGL
jgi:CheY-like chemotaxis protein